MTARAKHTPGPWYAGQEGDDWKVAGGYDARARVLSIRTGVIPSVEDARLIAAAPDLLAACEAFVSNLDAGRSILRWSESEPDVGGQSGNVDALRSAIRKARGES